MTSKQKDLLNKYIKSPSENGVLVIESSDWLVYREYLKNRIINISKDVHMMQLSFPSRIVLKAIVKEAFAEKGIEITRSATDFFIMRMSSSYDKYEEEIKDILDKHGENPLDIKEIKEYMKGIENFVLDDYIWEITEPRKKTLKMAVALQDELGATELAKQVSKKIDECIEFRVLINKGYIPIGINYFFNDTIESLPENVKSKYEKMNEWSFRRRAEIASRTSLRDWQYMSLILKRALYNYKVSADKMDIKCKRAIYDISTREKLSSSRINNIIGIDNIFNSEMDSLDKVIYKDFNTVKRKE
jgi:hypothetical protein